MYMKTILSKLFYLVNWEKEQERWRKTERMTEGRRPKEKSKPRESEKPKS